ncbi:leucine zipper protein 1 [Amia ocellicauda]|uniref:leucine zipper protein 1 n=1 Tax=Amia ocellicauda TaxID=2972642 RepID=UPI0034645D6D
MADVTSYKDTTNRHLRHKLQSLGRRLDELEEATKNLQKAEDELLDLQDKIMQAEGSSSSLLNDVDTLRKRVLKIEGKDEEVRKAEDLCRLVREKLEEEEKLTKELKSETEHLQSRMAELEKLEEAFSKSKSDCTQLCLSLNEEKNLTKKLSSELETLKARLKEMDSSESRLDRAEQTLNAELEKLKTLAVSFVNERKRLLEKQKEDEQLIQELTQKLEHNNKINTADQSRNASNLLERSSETGDLRIEDELSPGLTSKLGIRKKSLDFLKLTDDIGLRSKSENEKNSTDGQEDNKVKDLNQEIERLKNRLKQLELMEEDFKNTEAKNGELQEKFLQERNRSKVLSDQVEQLKLQLGSTKILENGKAENEEINVRGGFRQEKPKYRSVAAEPPISNYKPRELSPQQRREAKIRNNNLNQSGESSPKSVRRALSPGVKGRRVGRPGDIAVRERGRAVEPATSYMSTSTSLSEGKKVKKTREQPSVLSRYPPAANDQSVQKSWKESLKSSENEGKKKQTERFSKLYTGSDSESNNSDVPLEISSKTSSVLPPEKEMFNSEPLDHLEETLVTTYMSAKPNGSISSYRSPVSALAQLEHGSESPSSASETESTGSRRSLGETEPVPEVTALSGRSAVSKHHRYSRLQDSHSEASSTRSSFEEEAPKPLGREGSLSEATHTPSGIEIRRVCSPREALRSKAVIKPAIVEIDRKEVMSGTGVEPLPSDGKPKISTKPILNKMTSSITIYPSDPTSSRASSRSRSSSSSSELSRERHTSTSNIVITPTTEHRNSVSIPYEISIPKSEISCKPSLDAEEPEPLVEVKTETRLSRSSFTIKPPEPELNSNKNDESGFESGGGGGTTTTTTTVTSWRNQQSKEDAGVDLKNVTVRSTWRNKQGLVEENRGPRIDAPEEETESSSTWRAYRATAVLDSEETSRSSKPSPAEVYMRRIHSVVTAREPPEPVRRSQSTMSVLDSVIERTQPHEPVIAQELISWKRIKSPALEDSSDPPFSLRRNPGELRSYERGSRTESVNQPSPISDLLQGLVGGSTRGQARRPEGRGVGGRTWNNRQADN